MSSKAPGYNTIAFKVRVYEELYEKIVLEAGQLHLTVGEYARRVFEDRHRFAPLPPAAKPVAAHASVVLSDREAEGYAALAKREQAALARMSGNG